MAASAHSEMGWCELNGAAFARLHDELSRMGHNREHVAWDAIVAVLDLPIGDASFKRCAVKCADSKRVIVVGGVDAVEHTCLRDIARTDVVLAVFFTRAHGRGSTVPRAATMQVRDYVDLCTVIDILKIKHESSWHPTDGTLPVCQLFRCRGVGLPLVTERIVRSKIYAEKLLELKLKRTDPTLLLKKDQEWINTPCFCNHCENTTNFKITLRDTQRTDLALTKMDGHAEWWEHVSGFQHRSLILCEECSAVPGMVGAESPLRLVERGEDAVSEAAQALVSLMGSRARPPPRESTPTHTTHRAASAVDRRRFAQQLQLSRAHDHDQ